MSFRISNTKSQVTKGLVIPEPTYYMNNNHKGARTEFDEIPRIAWQ